MSSGRKFPRKEAHFLVKKSQPLMSGPTIGALFSGPRFLARFLVTIFVPSWFQPAVGTLAGIEIAEELVRGLMSVTSELMSVSFGIGGESLPPPASYLVCDQSSLCLD